MVGVLVGVDVGTSDGDILGTAVGTSDGDVDGDILGTAVGTSDGDVDGDILGTAVGISVVGCGVGADDTGAFVGDDNGCDDG